MEPLPVGANFIRCKTLWEVALHLAGDPATPYYGNRDMCIAVGKGSGDSFRPWLRMATGAPHLARAVAGGDLDVAVVNPSGILTQAYRGTGMFQAPLPVRILASYPSWDRFVWLIHPSTGIDSLAQIKERRYPLRLSTREDRTHSTRVLIEQTFAAYGFSIAELESWGGSLQLNKGPGDPRRLAALKAGTVDAVFDEGLILWFEEGLKAGMRPITPEERVLAQLEAIGWRRTTIPAGRYAGLNSTYLCIDFSGWPLYTRAALPDEDAYKICAAVHARAGEIPWDEADPGSAYAGIAQLGGDTAATPRDVPLHPGAARWYREQGANVPD
jgi:TRAP-type uncharacterized transport system substrate-binding protein